MMLDRTKHPMNPMQSNLFMNPMQLIVITSPDFLSGEAMLITQALEQGVDRIHLRKPNGTEEEYRQLLQAIPSSYHHRMVIHDHFALVEEFALGGVHLNHRHPTYDGKSVVADFTISRSCHSLSEIRQYRDSCSYLFLSPIFDSISKTGYCSHFTPDQLQASGLINNQVMALGGVDSTHVPLLRQLHFGGAALLGDIWQYAGTSRFVPHIQQLVRLFHEEE